MEASPQKVEDETPAEEDASPTDEEQGQEPAREDRDEDGPSDSILRKDSEMLALAAEFVAGSVRDSQERWSVSKETCSSRSFVVSVQSIHTASSREETPPEGASRSARATVEPVAEEGRREGDQETSGKGTDKHAPPEAGSETNPEAAEQAVLSTSLRAKPPQLDCIDNGEPATGETPATGVVSQSAGKSLASTKSALRNSTNLSMKPDQSVDRHPAFDEEALSAQESKSPSPSKATTSKTSTDVGTPLAPLVPMTSANARIEAGSDGRKSASSESRKSVVLARMATPKARADFLRDHPFFEGTSQAFHDRLAPELVQRNGAPKDKGSTPRTPGESAPAATVKLLEQDSAPDGRSGYLFLITPDIRNKAEVLFDGRPVDLSACVVLGQEVTFGIASKFMFEVRIAASAKLWVIPNDVIQPMMAKEFRSDLKILRHRAHDAVAGMLRAAVTHPSCPIRIRLFDSTEHSFRLALVSAMEIQVAQANERIGEVHSDEKILSYLFRGEARAKMDDEGDLVESRPMEHGGKAWKSWFGLLETLGACDKSVEEVTAVGDCVVWRWRQPALLALRERYPREMALLDCAGVALCRSLQAGAVRITASPILLGANIALLHDLETALEPRVYASGDVIIREGTPGAGMYFIARGKVSIYQQTAVQAERQAYTAVYRTSADEYADVLAYSEFTVELPPGEWFGELAALGFQDVHNASAVSPSICDLRLLSREAVVDALSRSPSEASNFLQMALRSGYQLPESATISLNTAIDRGHPVSRLFDGFSPEFINRLAAEMKPVCWFKSQVVIKQGAESDTFGVVMCGTVSIEVSCVGFIGVDGLGTIELEAPALLGEMCVVQPGFRNSATVRGKGICHSLAIKSERVTQLLKSLPADMECMRALAGRKMEDMRVFLLDCMKKEKERLKKEANTMNRRGTIGIHADFLSASFFKGSDVMFIDFLAEHMTPTIHFDGQVILQQDDEGDFAILIQGGSAVVEVSGVRVGEVHTGSVVGEMAVMGVSERRTATVRAIDVVSAFHLPRSLLLKGFEQFPEERTRMEKMLELRKMTNKMLNERFGATQSSEGGSDTKDVPELKHSKPIFNAIAGAQGESSWRSRRVSAQPATMAEKAGLDVSDRSSKMARLWAKAQASTSAASAMPYIRRLMSAKNGSKSPEPGEGGEENGGGKEDRASDGSRSLSARGRISSALAQKSKLDGNKLELPSLVENRQSKTASARSTGSMSARSSTRADDAMLPIAERGPASARLPHAGERDGLELPEVRPPAAAATRPSPRGQRGAKKTKGLRRAEGMYGQPVWHEVFGS